MEIVKTRKQNKTIEYLNIASAFDIETSSFEYEENKTALMYVWQFGIDEKITIGRTWEEFIKLCNELRKKYNLSNTRRLVVYVHNLEFEFQFMRTYFKWDEVFTTGEKRRVIYALSDGIEFRCSYILTGLKLEDMPVTTAKLKGNLDYNKIRTSETPLTEKELEYCINDIKIIIEYINNKIKNGEDIAHIPYTKTAYVRNLIRKKCFENKNYKKFIKRLTLSKEDFLQCRRAFAGGFTHSNAALSERTLTDVTSYDFSSSYPAVIVSEKEFPLSRPRYATITNKEQFEKLINSYACIFDIQFKNIKRKDEVVEDYISASKCYEMKNVVLNNGRIYRADSISTCITNIDFNILTQVYQWENMKIGRFMYFDKGYLPKEIIEAVLSLYQDKQALKYTDKNNEYRLKKELLNSIYGMMVFNPCKDEIEYNNDIWETSPVDYDSKIEEYNNSNSRFLYYPWGVFITALARKNLFTGIIACGDDYIYSDTDSIKILNAEQHQKYIDLYNEFIRLKINNTLSFYKLKYDVEGLGEWDKDAFYTKFKTLGAKRYMTEENNEISITVSGLNKKEAVPFIQELNKNAFDAFNEELVVPAGHTGKLTHSYFDYELEGTIKDYLGNTYNFITKSGVHLEQCGYSLNILDNYIDFINGKEYRK